MGIDYIIFCGCIVILNAWRVKQDDDKTDDFLKNDSFFFGILVVIMGIFLLNLMYQNGEAPPLIHLVIGITSFIVLSTTWYLSYNCYKSYKQIRGD